MLSFSNYYHITNCLRGKTISLAEITQYKVFRTMSRDWVVILVHTKREICYSLELLDQWKWVHVSVYLDEFVQKILDTHSKELPYFQTNWAGLSALTKVMVYIKLLNLTIIIRCWNFHTCICIWRVSFQSEVIFAPEWYEYKYPSISVKN